MACELPVESGVPLSRWSSSELAREAITRGIVKQISGVTVCAGRSRIGAATLFAQRAGPILDLYAGYWQGQRLQGTWPNMTVMHTPIHASWVNQRGAVECG